MLLFVEVVYRLTIVHKNECVERIYVVMNLSISWLSWAERRFRVLSVPGSSPHQAVNFLSVLYEVARLLLNAF